MGLVRVFVREFCSWNHDGFRVCVFDRVTLDVRLNMSDVGGQMRSKIPAATWEQVKIAYASGVGLREIARKMQIPPGSNRLQS